MLTGNYCQSCNMPLDNPEIKGTEKDGSISAEYCRHCYANGEFINDKLTLDDMKQQVKIQMEKLNFPIIAIERAVYGMPQLKRWRAHMLV